MRRNYIPLILFASTLTILSAIVVIQLVPFTQVEAQLENKSQVVTMPDPSISYAETSKNLLSQAFTEFKKGNYIGAEELAINAYLDNFEYVEASLEKKGASNLMQQLETMMNKDIRNMIKQQ